MQKALVSVTGVDKPGIIARVSTALFEMNINVLEISQTILDGYFTMLMIVDITNATAAFSEAAPAWRRSAMSWARPSASSAPTSSTPCTASDGVIR